MNLQLILSVVGAVLLLVLVWKLTRKLIAALILAALAAAVIYVVVPILAERNDDVGKAARGLQKAVKAGEETVKEVAEDPRTKALGKKVMEGAEKAIDAAKNSDAAATVKAKSGEAVEKAKEAVTD